jgi:hypothetical protein
MHKKKDIEKQLDSMILIDSKGQNLEKVSQGILLVLKLEVQAGLTYGQLGVWMVSRGKN